MPTYAQSVVSELDGIAAAYADILAASDIENVDPGPIVGLAPRDWTASDNALEAARMALLRCLRDWEPRFRLIFPHPTPTVSERLDEGIGHLMRWLVRDDSGYDYAIPPTIAKPEQMITATVSDLRDLTGLLPSDDYRSVWLSTPMHLSTTLTWLPIPTCWAASMSYICYQ